jgi:hypothetical protein
LIEAAVLAAPAAAKVKTSPPSPAFFLPHPYVPALAGVVAVVEEAVPTLSSAAVADFATAAIHHPAA